MADKKGFTIEVSSSYTEFWRYNTALMCGCFDAQDVRTGFASAEDTVAGVGANLTAAPEDYPAHRKTTLETPAADHLLLYVYIVPHTLPTGNDIAATKPFPLQIRITANGRDVLKQTYPINQWSGASIELKVTAEGATASAVAER